MLRSSILLLVCSFAYASDYKEATNNAKEAFLVQSGAYKFAGKTGEYVIHEAHAEVPVAVCGYIYKVVRDKKLVIPLHDKKITVTTNQIQVSLPF